MSDSHRVIQQVPHLFLNFFTLYRECTNVYKSPGSSEFPKLLQPYLVIVMIINTPTLILFIIAVLLLLLLVRNRAIAPSELFAMEMLHVWQLDSGELSEA